MGLGQCRVATSVLSNCCAAEPSCAVFPCCNVAAVVTNTSLNIIGIVGVTGQCRVDNRPHQFSATVVQSVAGEIHTVLPCCNVAVVVVTNTSLNIMDTGGDWPEQGGQLARSTVVQQKRQAS